MQSRIITSTQTKEEELRSRLHVQLERDGGNPSQLLELIMLAVRNRVWEAFNMSFSQFIETPFAAGGLGWSVQNLKTVLKLRHRWEHELTGHKDLVVELAAMRLEVAGLLEPLREKAGPREGVINNPVGIGGKSDKRIDNFDNYQSYQSVEPRPQSIGGGGTSEAYTKARLRRDNPDLYARVMAGELSPNAAAIEAGWRKAGQRLSLPNDPIAAARYLVERKDAEWIAALVKEIQEYGQE